MMLEMLAADHHHSPPRRASSPVNGSLIQMPFSLLGNVLRKQTGPAGLFAKADATGPALHDDTASPPAPTNNNSNNTTTTTAAAPHDEPLSPTSRPPSVSSAASDAEKRRKRAVRPKTTYKLAQPPPSSHQKLHLRPKVLLQLHQVVAASRPRPVYEVIPYSILAPVSTRRVARTFRRDKLGAQDLLIVKAEEYGDEVRTDDERYGTREVVGIICPAKDDKGSKTEVLMDNGSAWDVRPAPNGGYEFSYTDEHGLTLKARWITRPAVSRTHSVSSVPPAGPDTRKFKFSTISPNSRRHPVIATMTRDQIDVFDTYTMPSATSPATPNQASSAAPTPAATPSAIDIESFLDKENLPVTTDDALRRFIVASGIWVAFCENWSPAYAASKAACITPLSTPTTARFPPPNRSISMTFAESPRDASPSSATDEKKGTIPRLIRSGTSLLHRNASFDTSRDMSTPASPTVKTRGRRSNSTGHAEVPSAVGSTRKRSALIVEDQPLAETEEEREGKRSAELRSQEPATPASPPLPSPSPNQGLAPASADAQLSERSLSPASSDSRTKKTRSIFNPVTTKGLWDSGVEGRGLKARPTSMVVVQEKNKKARRKEARSRSKEREKEKSKEKSSRRKSEGFKQLFSGIFRREKVAA